MTDIVQLTEVNEKVLADVNVLVRQLSERLPLCTLELLQQVVESPNLELWVVKENEKVVGMGELVIVLKPEGVIAQIEDVVVSEDQRGKGLGKIISEKLIERARTRGARVIQLSSRSDRTAANALYQKLGFKLRETNMYHLRLS